MLLELYHNKIQFECELHINDISQAISSISNLHSFKIPDDKCNIKIYVHPFKIQPIVRIDNCLVNYGLAKITPWDHMLEFDYTTNFFDIYHDNIINSKKEYYNIIEENNINNEYYVGTNNAYPNLVKEIYELIS